MKLALVFLMVGAFVATLSQQQNQPQKRDLFWVPPHNYYGAARVANYGPLFNYAARNRIALSSGRSQQPLIVPLDQEEEPEGIKPSSVTYQHGEDEIEVDNNEDIDDLSYYQGRPSLYHSYQSPRFWLPSGKFRNNGPYFYPFLVQPGDGHQYYRSQHQPGAYVNEDLNQPLIQSRRRNKPVPVGKDPAENRLFGLLANQIILTSTSNTFRFPFGKTSGVLVTSTLNLTSVLTCVAASEFITANPTACRRRKRGVERLLTFDDQQDDFVIPTDVQNVETTAIAEPHQLYEERNARLHQILASSKDDLVFDEDEKERDKRSFFYLSTTTFTSYTFFNTTVTKTVRLLTAATTSGLTCLPASFTVC